MNANRTDPTQLRHLVREVSNRDISTEQAVAFLNLFGEALDDAINRARSEFIQRYFGSRNVIQDRGPR